MKKAFIFGSFLFAIIQTVSAQANKTNLSLQVSAAAAANRAQLAGYVWNRTVQVFEEGVLKLTTVSSLSVGADGKVVATATTSTPAEKLPGGIRGDIARKKIADLKNYVEDGVKTGMSYLYLSKGKMVDFFDGGTITQSGNTISVKGSNVNKPNDQLVLNFTKGSYAYISQNFSSTVTNGDPVSGTVNYQTFKNGLTAINNDEIDLPAKKLKLMISNSNYAKKLQ